MAGKSIIKISEKTQDIIKEVIRYRYGGGGGFISPTQSLYIV